MLIFFDKVPDFNPVNAGSRASTRIPTGPTYREFIIKYSNLGVAANLATMQADIEEVALKINGTKRYTLSGAQLIALMKYYGQTFTDGELIINLSRGWMRTPESEENLAWGTKNVTNMHLEIKLAAGAVNPELSVDAVVTPESRDLGTIIEINTFQYDAVSAGKKEIPDLPKENGALVALHLESALITNLEVTMNKVPFISDDADLNAYQRYLTRLGGRVPQAGFVHVEAMSINRLADVWTLAGLQEFRVNPTMSAAGSIPIIMETVNVPLAPTDR